MSDSESTVNNTPFDKDELEHFEQLLKQEEQETRQEIDNLQSSINGIQSNQGDENSAAAHHQGDIASEEDEREKFLIMLNKEKNKIEEITDALARINQGTYGICLDTGKEIQKERLEAIPYTPYSIEASKKEEYQ